MKDRAIRFLAWKARQVKVLDEVETRRRVKTGEVQPLPAEYPAVSRWWPVGKRGKPLTCPYGEVGSVLWVQEPWRPGPKFGTFELASSVEDPEYDYNRWSHAHTMPRLACDTHVIVLSILVERVQDITEEGARLEGVPNREAFKNVWNSIHGANAWDLNEWVWVLRLRKFRAEDAQNTEKEA